MSNRDLENICIEKDIAISMTEELGVKISKIIKSNFSLNGSDESNQDRDSKIIEELQAVKIEKAFILEEERW